MRIIAGELRGTRLAEVGRGDPLANLRPTTDRIRENLFNILVGGAFGDVLRDANVLDIFAGTGALGLEALSRGAKHVTFVDSGSTALSILRKNIELTQTQTLTNVIRSDARRFANRCEKAFDLIFLDPPYGKAMGEKAINAAIDAGWIEDRALIVWEENRQPDIPANLTLLDQRKYGGTLISFLEFRQ